MRSIWSERYEAAIEKVHEARKEFDALGIELILRRDDLLRLGADCSLEDGEQIQMSNEAIIRLIRKVSLAYDILKGKIDFPPPPSTQSSKEER